MKVAASEQIKLVDVQEIDQKLAKLRHQKKTLPELEQIQKLREERRSLVEAQVSVKTRTHDAQRRQRDAEVDVEKVVSRQNLQQSRLDSGEASHKELSSLQGELNQLARRRAELEAIALEAMEQAEQLQQQVDNSTAKITQLDERIKEFKQKVGESGLDLDEQIGNLEDKREELISNIDPDLVAEYERIRERTGGVGIVCVRGRNVVDSHIDFAPAEWEEIRSASPGELIYSEEYEYLIVRLPQL